MKSALCIFISSLLLSIVPPYIVHAGLKGELHEFGRCNGYLGRIGDTPVLVNHGKIHPSKEWENRLGGGSIDEKPWFLFECEDIGSYQARITLFEPIIKEKIIGKNEVFYKTVKGQQVAEIQVTRRITRDGGVRIVEWIAPNALIAGKQTSFVLKKPNHEGYAIKLDCSDNIISESGLVAVLIRPDFRNDAEKWFRNKGYIFRRSKEYFNRYIKEIYGEHYMDFLNKNDEIHEQKALEFYNLQPYKEVIKSDLFWANITFASAEYWNLYICQVPIGNEFEELKEILKQKWVFDASIDFHEEGPSDSYLTFPGESIFRNIGDQQVLRQRLISVLKQKFTSIDISTDDVVVYRPGLSYKFKLKTPMANLGNREFEGYWLKADVIFEYHHNIHEGKVYDIIVIQIPDGFLARWDRSAVPPDGHFDHLSPTGKTKYHNFTSLDWLMEVIGNHIAQSWNGTFENVNK